MKNDRTMLGMLAVLAARGLGQSGVASERWLEAHAGRLPVVAPAARVPLDKGLQLWRQLPEASGRDTIGLQLAGRVPVSTFHLLGTAVASAPHLFGAVQVFSRYFHYLCTVEHLSDRIAGDTMTLAWDDAADVAPSSLRDFVLAQVAGVLDRFGVEPVRPARVALAGPAPRRWRQYQEVFGCPVEFDAAQSAMVLGTRALTVPLFGSNPSLHTAVTHRLGAFDRHRSSVTGRVVGVLEQLLDDGDARIESVAEALGMSPRSLQKQLALEGSQFSDLLRRVRQRRAVGLLRETDTPVAGVAAALGYGSVGSFSRAFNEWFGCSPGAYREADGRA